MKIIGTVEAIETGAIERTESGCTDYRRVFGCSMSGLNDDNFLNQ